ncbi:MAG: SDR family oxidoreductase [Pseudomonadota bacterium]
MMRTVLITGAGQNIGRAVAVALAEDGFNIVVNGLSNKTTCDETAEMVRAAGQEALVVMGDAGTRDGCLAMAKAGKDAFGQIDVLVHNAAIRPSSPFLEMDEDEWHRVMDVNLMGSFWLTRACLPGMVATGWGRLILFAGMNAIHGYNGRAHVSVSKHGNWGLVKSLGKEFGPNGITANMISPGPIASEHADPAMTAHIKDQEGRIPVGRLGEPYEVAATVSLLASDKGAFINGQMIQVNGGTET